MYWLSNPGYCWYRFKSSIASTGCFYFLIRLLIFILLVMIIIGSFQSINIFLNEVLYYMRKCNIYVMFVNILFFSVVFTFTLISLPIYDKIFHWLYRSMMKNCRAFHAASFDIFCLLIEGEWVMKKWDPKRSHSLCPTRYFF